MGNFELPLPVYACLPNQRRKSVQNDVQETLDIAAQFFVHSVKPVHAFGLMDEQFAHLSLRFCDLLKERSSRRVVVSCAAVSLARLAMMKSIFRWVSSGVMLPLREGSAGDSNITQCRR